jgi:dephospho-CoA kinase
MRVIGLTGGIGSGKSTVARILAELGAEVISADLVGHEVYRPGTPGFEQVTAAFGREVVGEDGTVDRRKLGGIVFASPAALAELNRIVHPLIAEAVRQRIEHRRSEGGQRPIVIEAAVLIEANWVPLVDEVWVVRASPEAVVERIATERGLAAAQIRARIESQIDDEERRSHADVVIENTAGLDDLRARVEAAWQRIAG